MKRIPFIFIGITLCTYAFAQNGKATKPGKIFFTSFIGIGTVRGDLSAKATSGLRAMTGVEYKFNRHHSLTGVLNFDGYSYTETAPEYSLSGPVNTIPFTVLHKYTFGKNKWLPFVEAGVGAASISIPVVSQTSSYTDIGNNSGFAGQVQVAVGLNYAINSQYLIFTEAAYQQYAKTKVLNNRLFNVNAFRIGISTAL